MATKIRTTSRRLLTRLVLALIGVIAMSAVLALGFRATADGMLAQAKASRHPTVAAMVRAVTLRR